MDGMEPATVWAVRLGQYSDEVRGELTLDADEGVLEFRHDKRTKDTRIPLSAVRRARRLRGSPVLEIDFAHEDAMVRMAFFFSQPPPVEERPAMMRGRKAKRQNITFLMGENAGKRNLVKEWRDAVQKAVREARR
jgi:hypothetical protein